MNILPQLQRNLRSRIRTLGIQRPAGRAIGQQFGTTPAAITAAAVAQATDTVTAAQFATITTTQRAIAAGVDNGAELIADISMGEASPSALVFVTDPTTLNENREFRTLVKGVLA